MRKIRTVYLWHRFYNLLCFIYLRRLKSLSHVHLNVLIIKDVHLLYLPPWLELKLGICRRVQTMKYFSKVIWRRIMTFVLLIYLLRGVFILDAEKFFCNFIFIAWIKRLKKVKLVFLRILTFVLKVRRIDQRGKGLLCLLVFVVWCIKSFADFLIDCWFLHLLSWSEYLIISVSLNKFNRRS